MTVNLQKEVQEGHDASRWLDDETTRKFFSLVREGILEAWKTSPVDDEKGQNKLRLMWKLMDDIEGNARTIAKTGELAGIQLEHERNLKKRAKDFLNKYGVRV